MQIKILILTDNLAYWILRIKECMKPIAYSEGIDKYVIENELFRIEIKSELRESRGQRYNAIVLDKYIPEDTLSKIAMPQMSICYTNCYNRDIEKEDCKNNKNEKGKITLGEFLGTIALGEVTIFSQTTELVTWKCNNAIRPEHFFSEEILNSKIEKVHGNKNGMSVLIDYKEENK